ncbi:tubulin polyglutamylase TTLL4-like isoform X2 [Anguilla anguilla]|uniref:tubulin polyglutamylase TTLL4-like isoform X2 n=1 Tax=Anguilla anguilla TaxID=7936 RepID=UPI0015B35636|nr:tubulin polyglutamylase TTLL4-like isoform X2 [Anguilla anguilla]
MSAVALPTARAAEDQLLCVSGAHPPPHAYLCVLPATSTATRAGGVWDACASSANAKRDGGGAFAVVPATPRPSSVPPVASPISLEPGTPGSGPSWPSEPARLRSTLLGKRAFSPQPGSAYPTCPSLPKAPPTMPTNQSSPWDSHQLRGSRDGTTRLPDASLILEAAWPQREAVDTYGAAESRLGPGPASGVDSRSSWTEVAQAPPCPVSPLSLAPPPSLPPSPPLAPYLSDGIEEPCSLPADASSAPCLDAGGCVCDVPCSAAVSRGGAGDRAQSDRASPERHSVCSVTTQISSIHLTKESHPQDGDPCSPKPPLLEHGTVSQETIAALLGCGEEEELTGKLGNQCSGDDDNGSEASTLSEASAVTLPLSNVEELMTCEDCRTEKPALVPSLFPSTPPTLYFSTANERVEMLPPEQSSLLKWKISSVTPNVVKNTLTRSHFKHTKEGHDWLGCWGHHMKSIGFRALHEHQKLNHFPGSFQIGRKDRLWRNLSKMQILFGRREFSFLPQSFVLPQDRKLLKKAWEASGRRKWIIKPPASARGNGIQVIHRWGQLPRRRPLLVQKYLHKPFLIDGSKFDLRIYVYVSSYNPLRIYIFTDGLVRFASCKYSSSMKSLSNKFMHLTNYSVNKENSEYQRNNDDQSCQGHKWALKALWQYLGRKGVNTTQIWEKIKDIVIKTIIAADPYVNALIQTHVRSAYSCHELFGFDIMLDENLKPWLLEVNISPSLHSHSALDLSVKGQMVRDVLNLAGFVLPRQEAVHAAGGGSSSSACAEGKETAGVRSQLAAEEKAKRVLYESRRFADQEFLSSVLDALTPGDVRALVEAEDELSRRGEFERVFPCPVSLGYMRFFTKPRYLNVLLSQWEQRHGADRSRGVSLLRVLCQKGVQLDSASDSACAKCEPSMTLSPTQDAVTSGVGSGDQEVLQRDL